MPSVPARIVVKEGPATRSIVSSAHDKVGPATRSTSVPSKTAYAVRITGGRTKCLWRRGSNAVQRPAREAPERLDQVM